MRDWRVVDNHLSISSEEQDLRIQFLVKSYMQLVPKLGHFTPAQVLDVIQSKYDDWFKAIDPKVNIAFIEELDKAIIKLDVDPYWEVSFDRQKQAGDAFNTFIKRMRKLPTERKKDKLLVSDVLNDVFGKTFGIATDNNSIILAMNANKQLKRVAFRIFKKLQKMGYAF